MRRRLPEGAFFAFPSITPTGLSARAVAERRLAGTRVAGATGSAFGLGGEEHVRCSYEATPPKIEEALERRDRFVRSLPGLVSPTTAAARRSRPSDCAAPTIPPSPGK